MLSQLARLLREKRDFSTFLVLSVLCLVARSLPLTARDGISTVLSGVLNSPSVWLRETGAEFLRVRKDNDALRELAVGLALERAELIEARTENERLRELLRFWVAFPNQEGFVLQAARVVGMPGSRIIERLDIDQGKNRDIKPGMAVIVPEGLVGKVVRVFPTWSQVEPLASASSRVSVVVEGSDVRGIVRPRYGNDSAFPLLASDIDYVPARSDIHVGDRVITSGVGPVYPRGITVGVVSSVVDGPVTMSVSIRPAVDLARVEQVFVVVKPAPVPLLGLESVPGEPQDPPSLTGDL